MSLSYRDLRTEGCERSALYRLTTPRFYSPIDNWSRNRLSHYRFDVTVTIPFSHLRSKNFFFLLLVLLSLFLYYHYHRSSSSFFFSSSTCSSSSSRLLHVKQRRVTTISVELREARARLDHVHNYLFIAKKDRTFLLSIFDVDLYRVSWE